MSDKFDKETIAEAIKSYDPRLFEKDLMGRYIHCPICAHNHYASGGVDEKDINLLAEYLYNQLKGESDEP